MDISRNTSLTLFEHEAKEYHWTDLDLVELAKLSRMAGVEVLRATVIGGRRVLQATQHIGVFCFRQTTVQVLPKIYRSHSMEERPDQEREATKNLLFLMSYTLQLSVREYNLAPLTNQHQSWFEGLISIFATHLLEEWQRGPYRHYQEVKETLPFLKEKLDIASQLRYPASKHHFTVTYDEYTVDIPLNRIFRFVVEQLWRITRSADNKRHLTRLRQWMEEITLLPQMTVSDTNTVIITRLNKRFAALLELARLFLNHEALQLARGNISTYAFVIDMNQLFESFLTNFIIRYQRDILPATLQECKMRPQSAGVTRYLATSLANGRNTFQLKPDLVIYDQARAGFPLLIDMKYKRIPSKGTPIASDDFYQMFAYAHRYHCQHVLLLYPQTADLSGPQYQPYALTGSKKVIIAATVDLCQDLQREDEQQRLKNRLQSLLRLE